MNEGSVFSDTVMKSIVDRDVEQLKNVTSEFLSSPSGILFSKEEQYQCFIAALHTQDSKILETTMNLTRATLGKQGGDFYHYINSHFTSKEAYELICTIYADDDFGYAIAKHLGKEISQKISERISKLLNSRYEMSSLEHHEAESFLSYYSKKPNEFYYFYEDFSDFCHQRVPGISEKTIEDMFVSLFEELSTTKLNMFDSRNKKDEEKIGLVKPHHIENTIRSIPTDAQMQEINRLRTALHAIFEPVFQEKNTKKINLYSRKGYLQAKETGSTLTNDYMSALLMNELDDHMDFFYTSHPHDSRPQPIQDVDYSFYSVLWGALSAQYVSEGNIESVHVYLPDGEIAVSSIFWNYELSEFRRRQASDFQDASIVFHQLTPSVQQEIKKTDRVIATLKSEISEISLDYHKNKKNRSNEENQVISTQLSNGKSNLDFLKEAKRNDYKRADNWEIVPFEKLKIKNLKMGDKPYTIEDLLRVSERLKKLATTQRKSAPMTPSFSSSRQAASSENMSMPSPSFSHDKKMKP